MSVDSGGVLQAKSNRGPKQKEGSPNIFCRLCKKNLRIVYGPMVTKKSGFSSYMNLFKPSARENDYGRVIAQSLHQIGISVEKIEGVSEVVCSPCGRKLLKLCDTFTSVSSALAEFSCEGDGGETFKRKIGAVLTPGRSPGKASRKQKRVTSPSKQTEGRVPRSEKTLFDKGNRSESEIADSVQAISASDAMLSKLNVDDLDMSSGSKIKVVIAFPSGHVRAQSTFDGEVQSVIMYLALGRWGPAIRAMFNHRDLFAELLAAVQQQANREFTEYSQFDSCLKITSRDQLGVFSNRALVKELSVQCPIFYSVVTGACKDASDLSSINAITLATSSIARTRNSTMSAVAYRISCILYHSGISSKDALRLNRLGISMSPDMVISMHHKMGENFDHKVHLWKKTIEENLTSRKLIEEIKVQQIQDLQSDDMEIDVNLEEVKLSEYKWYSRETYKRSMSLLEAERNFEGASFTEQDVLERCINGALNKLKEEKLPLYR